MGEIVCVSVFLRAIMRTQFGPNLPLSLFVFLFSACLAELPLATKEVGVFCD